MRTVRLFLLALAGLLFVACENEVDLLTPAEEGGALPVVFGLVNSSEDEQNVSLTRTFRFSDGGSAFTSAANPDSLYFPAEAVQVRVTNTRTGVTTISERVDLSAEGQQRNPGAFPVSPNILHRFELSDIMARPGDSIVLAVVRDNQVIAESDVRILSELEFSASRPAPQMYSLIGRSPFSFNWRIRTNGAPIVTYEVGFEFSFEETSPSGTVQRTLYFAPGQDLDANTNSVSNLRLDGFLPFLASRLTADPSITRSFTDIRLVITGGDENFGAYQELIRANTGITATQELPVFSNIEGGLGLFGSITQLRQMDMATLSNGTFDSLRSSVITRDLNF